MDKDIARPRGSGAAWRRTAWIMALAAQGVALSPAAHAGPAHDIRIENPCAPDSQEPEDSFPILRTPEEILRRQIASAVKREMRKHFEKLPYAMHCTWMETFKAHAAAEKLLYTQVHKEREAIEQQVFGDIALRLGLPTIADLYLHTDQVDDHGVVVKRSYAIEPLTDFVRRGLDFGLRRSATRNARDYIRNTRVNRFGAYSPHFNQDIDFKKLVDVLARYDAAGRIQEMLDARFADTTSPWSTPNAIREAAGTELGFDSLEALRKGDITLAQHRRLAAAIEADRGDGTGELTYAQYTVRVGRTWFSGTSPKPIQLPAFHVRLRTTREEAEASFLYMPGHPDGALRHLPSGTRASAAILGDSKDWIRDKERGPKVLAWLASRLSPADFHEVLGELLWHDKTGHRDEALGASPGEPKRRGRRALAEAVEGEPNALTQWLSGRLRDLFADVPGAGDTANIALALYPQGNRPRRFADAVAAVQLSRARSTMDPRFVGNLDADCARLEQIVMDMVQESLSLALLPFPLQGIETLQLLSIVGMMAHSTATYFANPYADANEAAALVADLADFGISLGLGVGAAKVGQRRGVPLPILYSPPGGGKPKLWFDIDTRRYAMSDLPGGAVPMAPDKGIYRKDNEVFVRLKTRAGNKVLRVVPDGAGYRVALDDGGMGPLVRPARNGVWKLSVAEQSLDGSAIAKLLLEDYTTDAATLARSRKVMHQFGLKERDLVRLSEGGELLGAKQILLGAVGHAFLEGHAARLRDSKDSQWTPREVSLVAPAMARHVDRPIVILDGKGEVDTAVRADGSTMAAGRAPSHALRVQRIGDRYVLPDAAAHGSPNGYPTLFAAVDAGTRPAGRRANDPEESEARFRSALADSIAGTTTRASLETMQDRWLDLPSLPARQRMSFKEISRLRHALHDKHHALTAADEQRLLAATRDLLPEDARVDIEVRDHRSGALLAAFADDAPAAGRIVIEADLDADGRRVRYYGRDGLGEARLSRPVEESLSPLIDVTLNAGHGAIRRALKMGEYQWSDFADRLMARIARAENALLPDVLGHLVVRDDDVRAPSGTESMDSFTVDGRRYARLTDLAGRSQIVEIGDIAPDGTYEILSLKDTHRGSGHFIALRDGKWYRSVSHEEARADFDNGLEETGETRPLLDDWNFGLDTSDAMGRRDAGRRDRAKTHDACIRPTSRTNRIYRRVDRTIAHWDATAMWNRVLPTVPANAAMRDDGILMYGGELYVPWQTRHGSGMARVMQDRTGYRIRLQNGAAGPHVARQADSSWDLAVDPGNYVEGSVVAEMLRDSISVNPQTIQRTARILDLMGLPESRLAVQSEADVQLASPLITLSLGQAFLETLPSRLRDPQATAWSLGEIKLLLPDMAGHVGRPLALYRPDGTLEAATSADGQAIREGAGLVPADALHLVRYNDQVYAQRGAAQGSVHGSIFAAVEAGVRPAIDRRIRDPRTAEAEFRAALALFVERKPAGPRFETMLQYWIDPRVLRVSQRRGLDHVIRITRLRQALFDRHHPLTASEEAQLLQATRDLMPRGHEIAIEVVRHGSGESLAVFDAVPAASSRVVIQAELDAMGRRIAYYQGPAPGHSPIPSRRIDDDSFSPLIDVLLNAGNGKVRKVLGRGEWDFREFADSLMARIAEDENALLPASLDRFVVTDPAVLADAETRYSDEWTANGRHFLRLRDLDGRTQVVETRPNAVNGGYDLLNYRDGLGIGFARIAERHGKWYPSRFLRRGFDPSSADFRQKIVGKLARTLPPESPITGELLGRVVDAIPYPNLLTYLMRGAMVKAAIDGELWLMIDGPNPLSRSTGVYMPSAVLLAAVATATQPPRPLTPLTVIRDGADLGPALEGATTHPVSPGARDAFAALMDAEAPIGDFVEKGLGNRHIQALVTARRLRTMLRSDEYMVFVGTSAGHSFAVAMPVNADSIRLLEQGGAYLSEFPEGTRILDDWFNFATTATNYPLKLRSTAQELESRSMNVTIRTNGNLTTLPMPRFVDQILASRVLFNAWSPLHDPISEQAYAQYVWHRYQQNLPAVPAGLDWLQTAAQRHEIARYFIREQAGDPGTSALDVLATTAVELGSPSEATTSQPPVQE